MTASDRRILVAHWVAAAHARATAENRPQVVSCFQRGGCLLTLDGSGDDVIKPDGIERYAFARPAVAAGSGSASVQEQGDVTAVEREVEDAETPILDLFDDADDAGDARRREEVHDPLRILLPLNL